MSTAAIKPPSPPSHPLSDIYPSPSPSPSLAPISTLPPSPPSTSHSTSSPHPTSNILQDTTTPNTIEESTLSPLLNVHNREQDTIISDIPRLQQIHSTAGYRDGITKGKAETIQQGFDEGVSLGGEFGLKVGELEGLVVGVMGALRAGSQVFDTKILAGAEGKRERMNKGKEENVVEVRITPMEIKGTEEECTYMSRSEGEMEGSKASLSRFQKLLDELRAALSVEKIFAREWFDEQGVWRYPVSNSSGRSRKAREPEGTDKVEVEEITFKNVVAAHPLLKAWDTRVKADLHSIRVFLPGNDG